MKVISVVVDELPESCGECQFLGCGMVTAPWCCIAVQEKQWNGTPGFKGFEDEDIRQDWCPLRSLPEPEKVIAPECEFDVGFCDGWNRFRRTLLGLED